MIAGYSCCQKGLILALLPLATPEGSIAPNVDPLGLDSPSVRSEAKCLELRLERLPLATPEGRQCIIVAI